MKATKKKKRETKDLTVKEPATLQTVKTVDDLLALALKEKSSLEQLDKLMQMKYRHEEREARKDFFQALSDFQSNIGAMEKSGKVGYKNKDGSRTDYKYAPLGQIEKQIKGPLANAGLSKRFNIKQEPQLITVECVITHIAGHSEKTSMSAPADVSGKKNTIQSFGSTTTYLQRYTLIGALGLVTADADNDGQTTNPEKPTTAPDTRKTHNVKPSEVLPPEKPQQARQSQDLILKTLWVKMNKFNPDKFTHKFYADSLKFIAPGVKETKDLTGPQITALIGELETQYKAEQEANK